MGLEVARGQRAAPAGRGRRRGRVPGPRGADSRRRHRAGPLPLQRGRGTDHHARRQAVLHAQGRREAARRQDGGGGHAVHRAGVRRLGGFARAGVLPGCRGRGGLRGARAGAPPARGGRGAGTVHDAPPRRRQHLRHGHRVHAAGGRRVPHQGAPAAAVGAGVRQPVLPRPRGAGRGGPGPRGAGTRRHPGDRGRGVGRSLAPLPGRARVGFAARPARNDRHPVARGGVGVRSEGNRGARLRPGSGLAARLSARRVRHTPARGSRPKGRRRLRAGDASPRRDGSRAGARVSRDRGVPPRRRRRPMVGPLPAGRRRGAGLGRRLARPDPGLGPLPRRCHRPRRRARSVLLQPAALRRTRPGEHRSGLPALQQVAEPEPTRAPTCSAAARLPHHLRLVPALTRSTSSLIWRRPSSRIIEPMLLAGSFDQKIPVSSRLEYE